MATTKPTYVDENGNVYTMLGNIRGPAGKDGINGKSIYANTVDPWSVSGWNPAMAGDLFLNTTTGILWSAKAGAVTSNVQSNWTKVGELAGKITVDSALSSTSTNPVQNKVINDALGKKANSSHSHSSLTNSSGRIFNVPTGGSGGEQKTLVITDDLNSYQPKGNYASSTHKHPISDINNLQSTIDGIYTDMGLQDEAIAGKADENHVHSISDITGLQTALDGKAASSHTHTIGNVTGLQTALDSKQAKGNYVTTDTAQTITGDKAFSTIRTNSNIIVQDTNNDTYTYYQNKKISYIGYDSDGNIVDDYTYTLPDKSGTFATTNDIPKTGYSTNGKNYKVSADSSGNLYVYVPWTDTNTTYSTATQSANGLMSAADKKKLDGIAEGANKITIDSSLSSTSTNPIQNKVIKSTIESIYSDMGVQDEAIAGKADSVHTHTKNQITDFPTIPTVNNPTITINQGGTKKGSFSLNQSGATTINLTDNNTTYTAGTGLSLSGTTFSVSSANVSTMMNLLSEGSSNPTDNDYYIAQFAGGGTTTTTYHRRPVSKLYNYMKGKFDSIYQAKGSYAASGHTHTSLNTAFVFNNRDMPQEATNLSATTTAHTINFYRNALSIPYQMDNANDGGILRCRGNSESNVIFELATWDDSGNGETIQFNYYPTTSQVTPTYSVSVPKKTGTIALTSDIPTSLPASDVYSWAKASTKPTYTASEVGAASSGHTHDGRYIRWNGSAADVNSMGWGTLTAANGYTILSHCSSSDGGDWGMVNKGGQIFMQLDGYYYQNEGRYRVLDTSNISMSFSNGVLTITYK